MGLLTKALEITWSKPEQLFGVIPFEGGMHFISCVLSAIGWLYADAGLRDLLVDSGVFAAGTVQKILCAKDFDRGLYAIRLIDEDLNEQFYKMFAIWCTENNKVISNEFLSKSADLENTPSCEAVDQVIR